jgi:hypothetical protein
MGTRSFAGTDKVVLGAADNRIASQWQESSPQLGSTKALQGRKGIQPHIGGIRERASNGFMSRETRGS